MNDSFKNRGRGVVDLLVVCILHTIIHCLTEVIVFSFYILQYYFFPSSLIVCLLLLFIFIFIAVPLKCFNMYLYHYLTTQYRDHTTLQSTWKYNRMQLNVFVSELINTFEILENHFKMVVIYVYFIEFESLPIVDNYIYKNSSN